MAESLSTLEKLRYGVCKKFIRDHMDTSLEVGQRLIEVRDGKLYRDEFANFELFCSSVLRLGKSHAYRLIAFAEFKDEDNLSPSGGQMANERQARAIAVVPESQRPRVIKAAQANGPITAKKIEQAAKEAAQPKDAEVIYRDDTGYQIPKESVTTWERKREITELMTQVSRIKVKLEQAYHEDDVLYRPINKAVIDMVEQVHGYLSDGKPYAVCLDCQGRPSTNKCRSCKGTGFICKMRYLHVEAREKRLIREKAYNLKPHDSTRLSA